MISRVRRQIGLVVLALTLVGCGAPAASPQPAAAGRLYVASLRSSDVRVMDLATGVAGAPASSLFNPHEFVEAGGQVWVSNYRSAAVSRLAGDGTPATTYAVAGEPHGLAAVASIMAVTQGRRGSVALLDVDSGALRAEVITGGEPHAVVARDGLLYAVDAAGGQLVEIDAVAARVTRRVAVGETPESVDISPDGRQIATANARSGDVALVDRDGFTVRRLLVPGAPVRVAFSPDGMTLAVSLQDTGQVAMLDVRAGRLIGGIAAGARPDGLAFSGDGRRLYVALTGEHRVAVVDVRARRVTEHLMAGDGPSGLLWRPSPP